MDARCSHGQMICSRGSVLAGRVAVWFDGEPREQLLAGLDVVAAFDHVLVSQIPPDAVTASLSGLAPDISPQDAAIQVNRVAVARHLPVSQVRALIAKYTQSRVLGILGEPTVNMLELNIALDQLTAQRSRRTQIPVAAVGSVRRKVHRTRPPPPESSSSGTGPSWSARSASTCGRGSTRC